MSEYRRVVDAPTGSSPGEGKDAVLAYLDSGRTVQAARGRGDDRLDPSRRRAVPLTVTTDGTWVWTGSTRYYLAVHDVWPEAEFVRHALVARTAPPVDDAVAQDVAGWLRQPAAGG